MYALEDRLNPKNAPLSHQVPMLPPGRLLGPLAGSLYNTPSPKLRINLLNTLPFTPHSLPRRHAI